jgi:hypothetical protein
MNTVEKILATLTREAIAERLGVSMSSISDAAVAGVMPARWYLVVRLMMAETGNGEPPLPAFAMRPDRKDPVLQVQREAAA